MESAFASASAISDQRQKIEQYKHILSTVLASSDIQQAKQFIDHSNFLSLSHHNFAVNFMFMLYVSRLKLI